MPRDSLLEIPVTGKDNLLADKFRALLESQVPRFLAQVVDSLLVQCHIDVSALQADHVCWRTESLSEYTSLVDALLLDDSHFELLVESEIGGRPIATFQLAKPIRSSDDSQKHQVQVIEIPSPKEGSPYSQGLEHVEFVIGDDRSSCTSISPWNDETHKRLLEDFQKRYHHVDWNSKAVHKKINPDLSVVIKVADFGLCTAKFHLMPLADVIAAEKAALREE